MTFSDVFHDILSFVNPRHAFGRAGDEFTRTLQTTNNCVLVATIVVDAYLIGRAIYKDFTTARNRPTGKHTIKATAMVAGAWAFSYLFGAIGTGFGAMFGGIGAVPGGIMGGWFGSCFGSFVTGEFMDFVL
jgi:hypothetical protein